MEIKVTTEIFYLLLIWFCHSDIWFSATDQPFRGSFQVLGGHMWLVAKILEKGAELWNLLTEGETPITGSLRKGCFYCIKNEVLPARPFKKNFFFFFKFLWLCCVLVGALGLN